MIVTEKNQYEIYDSILEFYKIRKNSTDNNCQVFSVLLILIKIS